MGEVSGVNRRRAHELSPTLSAEYFDVTRKDGHSYVGVKFEQQTETGGPREFRSDISHLEFIDKRAKAYEASGEKEPRLEKVGEMSVWFNRGKFSRDEEAVGVQILQKDIHDPKEWNRVSIYADDLARSVKEAKDLEQSLGNERKWHVLVAADSLTRDETGRIHAQAVRSFDTEAKARENLGRSSGLALYSEPQGRELSKGDQLELWADATVSVSRRHGERSVDQQTDEAAWSRERLGKEYAVAKWNDKNREPSFGQPVFLKGMAYGSNEEPEDFLANPVGGRKPGEPETPKWVLVKLDDERPGQGEVCGISEVREEMSDELGRREREIQAAEQQRNEVHRAVTKDWEQQSFGMNREEFTRGHSM